MIDIDARMKSLRLSWLPKILSDNKQPWKYLCLFWMNTLGGIPLCLQYNCSKIDMYSLCKKHSIPSFYSELLYSWAELHYLNIFHVTQIQNEIIWNNTNIKFQNKLLYFKMWHEKGVVKINQLIENGSWKDFEQINEMMRTNSLSTIFQYARIKTAFPRFWLDKLTKNQIGEHTKQIMQNNRLFQIKTGDFIDITITKAKQFYTLFVN